LTAWWGRRRRRGSQLRGRNVCRKPAFGWISPEVDHRYDSGPELGGEFARYLPVTAFIDIEGPLGADIQNLLELTGIQQDLLDPVLGLVGPLGGLFTS
jgi:hypothetical protein